LDKTIDQAAAAVTEGRDAVEGLRASTVQTNDLARAIDALGKELAADPAMQDVPAFRVTVEGASRDLHPILRDEIYRVASEALRNAFHHAAASQIEVEIEYGHREFRLCVRDNGKGMGEVVLAGLGPASHYGVPGMRERAELIGGKLVLRSELGAGTEVELCIPASTAYAKVRKRS
jgi:signal transduction histidine kinase